MKQPYDYLVYSSSGLIKAISGVDGSLVTSNAALDPVITTLLALGGKSTYVQPGSYTLSGSFAGWTISTSNTSVIFDTNANVVIPNAYASFVFKILPSGTTIDNVVIDGGYWNEAGTPARNWNFLHISGSVASKGINFCRFINSRVWRANRVLYLQVSNSTSWINSNVFRDIVNYDCKIVCEFDNTTTYSMMDNIFNNVTIQCTSIVTNGFKNICGDRNQFTSCKIWDINLNGSAISANLTTDAIDTIIVGGHLTIQLYDDLGTNTVSLPNLDSGIRALATLKATKDTQDILTLYRNNKVVSTPVGFRLDLMNSTDSEYNAAEISAQASTVTAGAETANLLFYVKIAGTLTPVIATSNAGAFQCGGANRRLTLSETGLTTFRTFTYPDLTDTVVTLTATQTETNKTFTSPVINTPIIKFPDVSKVNTDSPYSIATTDSIIRADATSGALTVTLPTAVGVAGKTYTIRRVDTIASTNLVTVATTSSQTIGGAPNEYLYTAECLVVESDGTNWQVLARTAPSFSNYYTLKNSTNDRRLVAGSNGSNTALLISTISPAANTLWALPLIVPKTTKFDTITFNPTTGAGGTNARCGIYRDNGNDYPGVLIFDTGSVDCTASGAKNTTITAGLQVFPPGLYWLAWECSVANIQIVCLGGNGTNMSILGYPAAINNISGYGYSVAHTYGALPDPYTGSATILLNQPTISAPVPVIALRPI